MTSSNDSIQKVTVEVDASSLERSSRGSITGIVSIRAGGVSFPEGRWSDFPVVVLSWWLEPVASILAGTIRVWECQFMDGPFSARLEQQQADAWTLRGLRSARVDLAVTVSCRAFIRSLSDASRQILRECKRRGWESLDIDLLESEVKNIPHDMV